MATRKKVLVEQPAVQPTGVKVEQFHVYSRDLIVFDEEHAVWKKKTVSFSSSEYKGAIVRLRPPTDASDERVESVRQGLLEAGSVRIKLEVRRGSTVTNESISKPIKVSTAREVVMQLVVDANTQDRDALQILVERTMNEERL